MRSVGAPITRPPLGHSEGMGDMGLGVGWVPLNGRALQSAIWAPPFRGNFVPREPSCAFGSPVPPDLAPPNAVPALA